VHADVRHAAVVSDLVKRLQPDAIFHLAGQVAMTTSLADRAPTSRSMPSGR